jgi:hypothetical protein
MAATGLLTSTKAITAALLLVVLSAGSCISVRRSMDAWVGHHESELLLAWGPPTQQTSDGAGGHILIYRAYRDFQALCPNCPNVHNYVATRMFYVNKDGIIYFWRVQGF